MGQDSQLRGENTDLRVCINGESPKWMLYHEKCLKKNDFWGTRILGNVHLVFNPSDGWGTSVEPAVLLLLGAVTTCDLTPLTFHRSHQIFFRQLSSMSQDDALDVAIYLSQNFSTEKQPCYEILVIQNKNKQKSSPSDFFSFLSLSLYMIMFFPTFSIR